MIDLKYEINKAIEKAAIGIAWALPRWLVYWCGVRLITHATTGKYGCEVVPELKAMDALKRWQNKGVVGEVCHEENKMLPCPHMTTRGCRPIEPPLHKH